MVLRLKYILAAGLLVGTWLPASAQLSIVPQFNTNVPVGSTREYGTPRLGYGAEVGYQLAERWKATVATSLHRFEFSAGLDKLDINATLVALLNLRETLTVDLSDHAWSGGMLYTLPYQRLIPFAGIAVSTNRITARGYGLSISRRYWGVAPVLGVEWPIAPRWSIQTDARLQTVFIRDNIPFVETFIDENLIFVPIQVGMVFQVALRQPNRQ